MIRREKPRPAGRLLAQRVRPSRDCGDGCATYFHALRVADIPGWSIRGIRGSFFSNLFFLLLRLRFADALCE